MEWNFLRSSYLMGIVEEADDFMDPEEADYGRACLVDNNLGIVEVGIETALVLGEEPMPTSIMYASSDKVILARWYYGETEAEALLRKLDWTTINNWESELIINFHSDNQYLFDAACGGKDLQESMEYLLLRLIPGQYSVSTVEYAPNERNNFYLHRLVRIDY